MKSSWEREINQYLNLDIAHREKEVEELQEQVAEAIKTPVKAITEAIMRFPTRFHAHSH